MRPIKPAAVLLSVLIAVGPLAVPTSAAPAGYQSPQAQHDPSVPGADALTGKAPNPTTGRPFDGPPPVWPVSGTAEVDLGSVPPGGRVRAGTLPVSVGVTGAAKTGRVRVELLDRAPTQAAGVTGVLLRLRPGDAGAAPAGPVSVTVDYSGFRYAHGGDWSSRLRLVALPECTLSTPDRPGCRARILPTRNDHVANELTADVDPRGGPATGESPGTLLAADAGPEGPAGDFAGTDLPPSATWQAGGSSGDFSWSYPIRMPPSLGGPVPNVALSYNSSSVDGRMAASNNQPSWLGEGFDFTPGYVERRYRPCGEDMGNGANNITATGDQCWTTSNAVLSLNGRASELIRDGSGRWHGRTDDGSRIELRTGGANGDNDGEQWVVTTTAGTQYWFGRNRLPGWASGHPETNSVLTLPVYGNHPSEPCHGTDFSGSACTQAYRWNLDYVVDPSGNTMALWYARETNSYARELDPTRPASYTRAGYLTRIDYGTRSDTAYGTVPMQVGFTPADRCLANCAARTATAWPDTPWDLHCSAAPCTTGSPTFWTTKRLQRITTKVWTGAGHRDVESWTFTHSFPDPGDGTRAGLWLDRIAHAGHVGGTATVPDVMFVGTQRPNRVDANDHIPAMNWWRVAQIITESGGSVGITYSVPDCVAGSRMPSVLHDNRLRCYPVRWTPEGSSNPITDFFHKYVVTRVSEESDATNDPIQVVTAYEYLGDPAWRYTDDDGLVQPEDKTWSVWRGYANVRTTMGDPGEQTQTETRYFRGLHGDRQPSGTRTVTLPPVGGYAQAVPDEDAFAGMARETIRLNGPGGAEVDATVQQPWQSTPTATRTINGSTADARFVNIDATWTRTALDAGRPPRISETRTGFDTHAMVIRTEDLGDQAITGDERCMLTDYARNTAAWLMSYVSRVRTFAVDCARASGAALTEAEIISDERRSYDGAPDHTTAPTRGLVTKVEALRSWDTGTQTPSYLTTNQTSHDAYGRVVTSTDVRGNTTSTAYTPATSAPITGTVTTNHLGWQTTTTREPAWAAPLSTVDPNGRRTDLTYDGLGRLTGVWLPGRDKTAGQSATMTFGYLVRNNAPTVVTTAKLTGSGGYRTSHNLLDGLLRPRQTQAPEAGPDGGRIVTDTHHDSTGRIWKTYEAYIANGPPGTALFVPATEQNVPSVTRTSFDGAGRPTVATFQSLGSDRWHTQTSYGGDRTYLTPPDGGTATTTITDPRGRTVELRQHHGPAPAGSSNATTYTYDPKGQLARVSDPAGNRWEYGYDLRGRQVRVTDPDKGTTMLGYNDAGDLISSTDARGNALLHGYDSLGRKTELRQDSTRHAEWVYDTLSTGEQVRGSLVRSTRYDGGNAYTQEITGYTPAYQPTGGTYTVPAAEAGLAGSYTYTYTYKPDGSPASLRLPDLDGPGGLPAETLSFGHNDLGLPTTMSTSLSSIGLPTYYINGTSYTRYGEAGVIGYRHDNGRSADVALYYEQGTRRLSRLWTTRETSPSTIADVNYTWDAAGNLGKISDVTSNDHQCLRYDRLRRLTEAWTPAGGNCGTAPSAAGLGGPAAYWHSWTYDQTGNRLSQVEHATPTGDRTTTYTHPAAGAPRPHTVTDVRVADSTGTRTTTYRYDGSGNLLDRPATDGTQALSWTAEGNLAGVSETAGSTSYVYDGNGARLIRRDATGKTLYLPGQELRWTPDGAKRTARTYTHAGRTIAVRTAAGLTWLVGDHQDTPLTAITATTQAVTVRRQTPFGTPRGAAVAWPTDKEFAGGLRDNTGLLHLGAREYDPALGRFVSVDPLIDHQDPQHMHGYSYANNTPATRSDPQGLMPIGGPACGPDGIKCGLEPKPEDPQEINQGFGSRDDSTSKCPSPKCLLGPEKHREFVEKLGEEARELLQYIEENQDLIRDIYERLKSLGCAISKAHCAAIGILEEYIVPALIELIKEVDKHGKASISLCDGLCIELSYQHRMLDLSVGLGGPGLTGFLGWADNLPEDQGWVSYSQCVIVYTGVCGGITPKVDSRGEWIGVAKEGGIGFGVDFTPSVRYTIARLNTNTGEITTFPNPLPPRAMRMIERVNELMSCDNVWWC